MFTELAPLLSYIEQGDKIYDIDRIKKATDDIEASLQHTKRIRKKMEKSSIDNYDEYLQKKILRDEWGFKGMVTTDWWNFVRQYQEIAAGNDIKMGNGMPAHTLQMLREGKLSREDVVTSAKRVLNLILKLA